MIALGSARKELIVPAAVFAGIFFLSLAIFLVQGIFEKKLLLFFPQHSGGALAGEARSLVRQKSIEKDLELVVEELILGPADIRHSGVLPRNTRVRSALVRRGAAYLDLSPDAIFLGGEVKMSFQEVLETVKKTVMFNFPGLENLIVTIDGQVPGEPAHLPGGSGGKPPAEKGRENR